MCRYKHCILQFEENVLKGPTRSGGSMISQSVVKSWRGVPGYYFFQHCCWKLQENERCWTEGACIPGRSQGIHKYMYTTYLPALCSPLYMRPIRTISYCPSHFQISRLYRFIYRTSFVELYSFLQPISKALLDVCESSVIYINQLILTDNLNW